ncbi:PEP-CTERM sorting domain-containing protein [bacterium]|nr:PEP-CTERM sorting domain-containing protein [bacterium]MDB4723170.1 PEP-CTERM sorting domain-containing protein [Akkermansiaceae bacterium]
MNHKLATLLGLLAIPAHGAVLWSIGADDQTQDGNGDATLGDAATLNGAAFNVSGVQEKGQDALPGNPANTGGSGDTRDIDDDYYFAGVYTTAAGDYTPVGTVAVSESYYDRALTNGDPNMRWHFNVPETVGASDTLTFTVDFYNLDESDPAVESGYDLTFFVDGKQIGEMQPHSDADLSATQSWDFALSDLGGAAEQGPGFDHYLEIRTSPVGTSRWASLDYVQLEANENAIPEPSSSLLLLGAVSFLFLRRRS